MQRMRVSRAIARGGSRRLVLQALKRDYRCTRRLVEEPVSSAVWLQQLGCFFLRIKKKVQSTLAPRRLKRPAALRVAGLLLSLHGLTTAHYKAREPSSVIAAADWLFFAF